MTKGTTKYLLRLQSSDPELAGVLKEKSKIPKEETRLAQAREYRRALATVFGGDAHSTGPVRLQITSVAHDGMRVRRV